MAVQLFQIFSAGKERAAIAGNFPIHFLERNRQSMGSPFLGTEKKGGADGDALAQGNALNADLFCLHHSPNRFSKISSSRCIVSSASSPSTVTVISACCTAASMRRLMTLLALTVS